MRTKLVLHVFQADEGDWRQVQALPAPNRRRTSARVVVAPARKEHVMRKSGRTLVGGELACVYGLTVCRRPAEPSPFRVPPTGRG
ncbi:MAG: hypothetical protein ACREXU_10560 [Gammaproteobacteria bacterium]